MNHLDLFAGIGGFSLAARMAGIPIERTLYSEIDEYACKVFQKNFPEALALGDIRNIDATKLRQDYEGPWLVTGGFPCQDISTAGKQRGIGAARSGLWYEMHRIIGELQPELVVIENVAQLATMGLDRVVCCLSDLGYDAEWQTIPVSALGGCHVRKRLWIVAYPSGEFGSDQQHREISQHQETHDMGGDDQSPQSHEGLLSWAEWQRCSSQGRLHARPTVCRMDDGLPDWLDRVKGLGNSICPQVAALVLRMAHHRLLPRASLSV